MSELSSSILLLPLLEWRNPTFSGDGVVNGDLTLLVGEESVGDERGDLKLLVGDEDSDVGDESGDLKLLVGDEESDVGEFRNVATFLLLPRLFSGDEENEEEAILFSGDTFVSSVGAATSTFMLTSPLLEAKGSIMDES